MLSLVVVVLFVAHHSFLPTTQASTEPKAEEHVFCAVASHTGRPHAQDATTSISRQPQQQPASKVKSNKVPNSNNTCIGLVFGDVVDNDFEYEENAGIQSNKVGGRLKSHFLFWRYLSPPEHTLNVVEHGYVIPFVAETPMMFSKNNKSAFNHIEFVTKAIKELYKLDIIEATKVPPKVVNPLTVSVQSSGKKRLILDLRLVNEYVEKLPVKYEDMRTALMFLQKGGYVYKFDLKSGYHHVDICQEHVKYLGFSWENKGNQVFYRFKQLPFGLSSAPHLFTKLLRPLVKKWRGEGKSIVVYLDDGLGFAPSMSEALKASEEVKADILQSGFIPNVQKSVWAPAKAIEWLGYEINLDSGTFCVPQRRILSIKRDMQSMSSGVTTARVLAKVIGKITSCNLVIGNVSNVMTKYLHICAESRSSWDAPVTLQKEARDELDFWNINVGNMNTGAIGMRKECSKIVYSDASSTGYGGYIVDTGEETVQGMWNSEDALKSSTWRELKAVDIVLKSLVNKLSCRRTKWFTDNQAVSRITVRGSMKRDLQEIALSICKTCLSHNIHIEMEWVPRLENERADKLSRILDRDDWAVADHFFSFLDELWGTHTVDRFASYYNYKIARFNSRFWNPGCEAIATFTVDWQMENNWVVPPISLIPRVLKHMQNTKAVGTLVCPCWYSAPFWPMLYPDGYNPARAVVEVYELPKESGIFIPGRGGNVEFIENIVRSKILAVRLDFTEVRLDARREHKR